MTLKMIGGKCKPLILEHLITHGTQRFSQLQRQLPQVSQRTLTNQLRELEADSLLSRRVYPQVPPRVEYTITPKGQSLSEILELMCAWGEKTWTAALCSPTPNAAGKHNQKPAFFPKGLAFYH